jgi:hypothetical protein
MGRGNIMAPRLCWYSSSPFFDEACAKKQLGNGRLVNIASTGTIDVFFHKSKFILKIQIGSEPRYGSHDTCRCGTTCLGISNTTANSRNQSVDNGKSPGACNKKGSSPFNQLPSCMLTEFRGF